MKVDPKDYIKLFNGRTSVFHTFVEVEERLRMELDGFWNLNIIFVDGHWYFHKDELKRYNLSDIEIGKVIDLVSKRGETFIRFTEQFLKPEPKTVWDGLIKIYLDVLKVYGAYMRIIDIPVYCSYFVEQNVNELMKKEGFTEQDFDILTHPLYNTYHNRRHKDILLLKEGDISRDEFKKRWGWSQMFLMQYKPVDDKFIDEQLSHVKDAKEELAGLVENHRKAKDEFQKCYDGLPKALQAKADLVQKLMYIRDFRFEQLIRGTYNLNAVFTLLGKKMGLSYEELIYSHPDEVKEKRISQDLKIRMKHYAYIGHDLLVGNKAQELEAVFNKPSNQDMVKGKGVSHGTVKGTAKVIKNIKELSKIEKGDIIICDITTPDYLHALRKVSAIVANIGGFTSHSAIVAREFGIPCVVGTGNATRVFKDGDRIEVDANKGTVKKIEEK